MDKLEYRVVKVMFSINKIIHKQNKIQNHYLQIQMQDKKFHKIIEEGKSLGFS